ncbi:hypothetical protein CDAR_235411 [Caerostris darwini]|uniref:Uncharacterized protein n=1 Tax=Caerostris darwini TaxID=1538125 RepID=A0AAV4NB00_9ARAC|nr:hypothetical protein CDAR_235411 [Caerostris darwini]
MWFPSNKTESFDLKVDYPESCDKLRNDIDECQRNCKPECLKLKYKYATKKIKPEPFPTWEVFSHVGSLVGCWLGISVWTAFNFFEGLYKSTVKLAFKMRNRSRRLAKTFISPMLPQV